MWDFISSAVTSVTTGVVGTGEKVPFSCQVPFKRLDESMKGADVMNQLFHDECVALKNSPKWEQGEFTDPDGGDMQFWTQPQVGTYHFVKVRFTIKKASIKDAFELVTSERKAIRGKFSADLAELEYFASRDGSNLMRIAYTPPSAGAAGRDFCFLTGEKKSEGAMEAWGCSVEVPSRPEDFEGFVRGACIYHWGFTQVGDDAVLEYNGCFDPRGWAPPFIISWFKTSATAEFVTLRKLLTGKYSAAATSSAAATAAA